MLNSLQFCTCRAQVGCMKAQGRSGPLVLLSPVEDAFLSLHLCLWFSVDFITFQHNVIYIIQYEIIQHNVE